MTRKDRFYQVMKEKGYDSVVQLMAEVEAIICGDKAEGLNRAKNNKNYSNMIAGTNKKDFTREYIVALEKVLNMKYIDMINPNSNYKASMQYDSLRSIAFENNYEKIKDFSFKKVDDTPVLLNSDEYNRHIADYIIEYKAINCLKFMVDEYGLTLDIRNFLAMKDNHFLSCKEFNRLPYNIANLIYEIDDDKLFNKIFNPIDMTKKLIYDWNDNIYEDEEFALGILNTEKILKSLYEPITLDINEANGNRVNNDYGKGIYANTLLKTVLNIALKDPAKYEKKIIQILDYSFYINRKISNHLKEFDEQFKIDEKGLIKANYITYGFVIKYDLPLLPDTSKNICEKVKNLNIPLEQLEAKESRFGLHRYYQVKDGKVYLNASNNDIQYEMMKYMNEKKFKMIPKLYEHNTEKNIDILEYKEPYDSYYYNIEKRNIKEIASFLKRFHDLSHEKLGNDKVYLHNNLSITNCSLKDGTIDAVVNWNNCTIGNALNEILFVIGSWTKISSGTRYKEESLDEIKTFVETYKLDESIRLGDELLKYWNEMLKSLKADDEEYEEQYEAIKRILIYLELYQNKLNERSW